MVDALAQRKRAMFPTDMRRVIDLQVFVEGGMVQVHAASAGYR